MTDQNRLTVTLSENATRIVRDSVQPLSRSPEELVESALMRGLSALSRIWRQNRKNGEVLQAAPAPQRSEIERSAVWHRFRASLREEPSTGDAHTSRAKKLRHWLCADPAARAALSDIESGSLSSQAELQTRFADPAIDLATVLHAMATKSCAVSFSFDVICSAGLIRDTSFDPCGGAKEVVLRGRIVGNDGHRRLTTVEIVVTIEDQSRWASREPHLQWHEGSTYDLPEFTKARLILDHVLATLRAAGAPTDYDDLVSDSLPSEVAVSILREFFDGTTTTMSVMGHPKPGSARAEGVDDALAPIELESDTFAKAWALRDELAAYSNGDVVQLAAEYQRLFLNIEADLTDTQGSGATFRVRTGEGEAAPILESMLQKISKAHPELFEAGFTPKLVREELNKLRDKVSHLQRRKFNNTPLPTPYGIEVYNIEFRKRLTRSVPIVRELAKLLLSRQLSFVRYPKERKSVPISTMIRVCGLTEYARGTTARNLVSRTLRKIANSGSSDVAWSTFVVSHLQSEEHFSAAVAAAMTCADLPEVFDGLVAAAGRSEPWAEHARNVIASAADKGDGVVSRLQERLGKAGCEIPADVRPGEPSKT
ncbi:MAG: hypothetical protein HOW73_41180 [Polyangiaceae bacterium]|nr:hypothetical protein [Polyangiaceae bacterium]